MNHLSRSGKHWFIVATALIYLSVANQPVAKMDSKPFEDNDPNVYKWAQQPRRQLVISEPKYQDEKTGKWYRLDWCYLSGRECGMPAASAFCYDLGQGAAAKFEKDPGIGKTSPTWILGAGKVCNKKSCDGFAFITCELPEKPNI